MRNPWTGAAFSLILMLVSSCGGGGGGGGSSSTNPVPRTFSYMSSYYAYTALSGVGGLETQDSFTNVDPLLANGGTWTASPALPPGLLLNPTDGKIGG